MSDIKSIYHTLLRLLRSAVFRSPAHTLPAIAILLIILLSTISFFIPAPSSSRHLAPARQLQASVNSVYKTLGIPVDDELGMSRETDQVQIENGETGPVLKVTKHTVRKGESVYTILSSLGIAPGEIIELTSRMKGRFDLRTLKAGTPYEVETNPDGSFNCLSWNLGPTAILHLEKDEKNGSMQAWQEDLDYETRLTRLEGTITTTLSGEMSRKGHQGLTGQLRKLLAGRIDLGSKLPAGTSYRILCQEKVIENRVVGTGDLLAVEITAANRRYNAYLFTDNEGKTGYYDERGRSLEEHSSLVAPCSYSRISSNYGYRVHPITGRSQFHGGVDFAAPVGTPIRAVADGRIIFRGWKGGAGNLVTIAHGNNLHTMYMHLSRFSPKTGYGRTVRQGEIIGYVGSTGSSTGPHLDFRVLRGGRAENPLTALAARAPKQPLDSAEMAGFMARLSRYESQLNSDRDVMVADASKSAGKVL